MSTQDTPPAPTACPGVHVCNENADYCIGAPPHGLREHCRDCGDATLRARVEALESVLPLLLEGVDECWLEIPVAEGGGQEIVAKARAILAEVPHGK